MSDTSQGLESRRLALNVLCNPSHRFARDILDEKFSSSLNVPDRRLVTEIVNGVLKYRNALRHIIRKYSYHLPLNPVVLNTTMLGLYQFLFMDKIPDYAAIDTSVRLIKESDRKAAPYVNAILRKIQKSTRRSQTLKEDRNILPVRQAIAWEFDKPIFVSPDQDLSLYWAMVYSYPIALIRRWYERSGTELCRQLLANGNMPPPLYLRLRPQANPENLLAQFNAMGIQFSYYEDLIQLGRCGNIALIPGFEERQWAVTGPASFKVVKSMEPRPGERVLDLCAAPGGKTLHIADLMQDRGELVAWDISAARLEMVKNMIQSAGLSIVQMKGGDGRRLPSAYCGYFDRVLVDVPCSNTAVLAKRAEARWRFSLKALQNLQRLQLELLTSGSHALRPGGILIYSTCSLEPEENEEVIEEFLQRHPEFECLERHQILPLAPHLDGANFFKLKKSPFPIRKPRRSFSH